MFPTDIVSYMCVQSHSDGLDCFLRMVDLIRVLWCTWEMGIMKSADLKPRRCELVCGGRWRWSPEGAEWAAGIREEKGRHREQDKEFHSGNRRPLHIALQCSSKGFKSRPLSYVTYCRSSVCILVAWLKLSQDSPEWVGMGVHQGTKNRENAKVSSVRQSVEYTMGFYFHTWEPSGVSQAELTFTCAAVWKRTPSHPVLSTGCMRLNHIPSPSCTRKTVSYQQFHSICRTVSADIQLRLCDFKCWVMNPSRSSEYSDCLKTSKWFQLKSASM